MMSFEETLRRIIREELASLKIQKVEDRLLTAEQAASLLQTSPKFLYAHANELPFTVRIGSVVRFSSQAIQKEIQRRLKQQGGT